MVRKHMRVGGEARTSGGDAVGARERLSVEQYCVYEGVYEGGGGRAARGTEVVARKRLPNRQGHVHVCSADREY